MFFAPSKSRQRAKIWNMGVLKTSDLIPSNKNVLNPSQDVKDNDVLCTFKIKIESQNSDKGLPKTIDHIQIKIKMWNPPQEPLAPNKARNQDLKDIDVLCTLKVKIES